MVGWLSFSVVGGVAEGLSGQNNPLVNGLVDFFGLIFFFSLPAGIIAEGARWWRGRKRK
jgi:hypothetical protein